MQAMIALMFLCASVLLLEVAKAGRYHSPLQSVNISSPALTESEIFMHNTSLPDLPEDHENTDGAAEGDSIPLIPLDIQPPGLQSPENDTDTKCDLDLCEVINGCEEDEICITTPAPDCKSICMKENASYVNEETTFPTDLPPGDNTTLRPLELRMCPGYPELQCIHGVVYGCDSDNFSFLCKCDSGWIGMRCTDPCPLECAHGECLLSKEGELSCACEIKYTGERCDDAYPESTEKSRILAAILSSALGVAIVLIIIIPVIMWRLRVILILKLIYIFKEYEDEDGKEFDAYVSMTSTANTEQFVYQSLQPILENENFKLYLQARDAPVGEVMSETILSALEKSRRTIMIITPDYIKNEWSRFEYLIAQHETLKMQQKIIPIILEDVDKEHGKMDKSLKHILDSIKCLKFPQAKSKSETSNCADIIDGTQSPDSYRSLDSTTPVYMNDRSVSIGSVSKEEKKFKAKLHKFWKRLILTMPKKKNHKDKSTNFFTSLKKQCKYEITTNNNNDKSKNSDIGKITLSEINFNAKFINDSYANFCEKSVNVHKTENITKVSNKERMHQNNIDLYC